jgi:hypothetical protein
VQLLTTVVSGVQILVMSILSLDSHLYTVGIVGLTGSCFGLVNLVVTRIQNSYNFNELASLHDQAMEQYNELKLKFILYDPERDDIEELTNKFVTIQNKVHLLTVKRCHSLLCCLN